MKYFGIMMLVLVSGFISTRAAASTSMPMGQEVISAEELRQMFQAGNEINYDDVVIQGDVDFTTWAIESERVISIDSPISIKNSTFTGNIIATKGRRANAIATHFNDDVNLSGTTFQGDVVFARASFAGLNLDSSHFLKSANFQNIVARDASFLEVEFGSYYDLFAGLGICKFEPNTDDLMLSVAFIEAEFKNSVNFGGSKFCLPNSFLQAKFLDDAIFIETVFSPYYKTLFTFAEFSGPTNFYGTRFSGPTNFSSTHFKARSNFDWTLFLQETEFLSSEFEGKTSFRNARFNDVFFEEATFKTLDMSRMEVRGNLDLTGTDYTSLITYTFDFDALERKYKADGASDASRTNEIIDMLTKIEANFRSQNHLELANDAFYRRNLLESTQKEGLQKICDSLFDFLFGYGVYPSRTIVVATVSILFFALVYLWGNMLCQVQMEKPDVLTLRLTTIPITSSVADKPYTGIWLRRIFIAIGFSASVLTKISFGSHVGVYRKWKSVVIVEWFWGFILIAELAYSLSKTSPLLQSMFGGLF